MEILTLLPGYYSGICAWRIWGMPIESVHVLLSKVCLYGFDWKQLLKTKIITQSKTSIEHIDTIIENINRLIQKKEDFTAFILIALGIEFLGSFFDPHPFSETGQSEIRFKKGVDLFKSKWYASNKKWLYKNYRGPLIHQFWTGTEILLTSYCINKALLSRHNTKENDKTIFVLEQLFEDFKGAAQKLINLSQKENSLNKKKLKQTYSEILDIPMDGKVTPCSGSTL